MPIKITPVFCCLLISFFSFSILAAGTSFSHNHSVHLDLGCTEWKKTRGTRCIDSNKTHYTRDCSQARPADRCKWRRSPAMNDSPCLAEPSICMFNDLDPNDYVSTSRNPEDSCTEWRRVRGVNCGMEPGMVKWERVCTLDRVKTKKCSSRHQNPNYIQLNVFKKTSID